MRQLDSEAKKTSANILKSLYESAASVKKQINTDKPEEAPKEEKEALIKKVQKPEVPHKEHIVESEDPFKDEKIRQLQDKVAELQTYLDDTPEVPEDEKTSIQNQIDEMMDEINYLENSLTEEVQVFDDEVSLDTVEDIYSVNEGIFAVINAALYELKTEDMDEDKKSKLVDKLNTLKAENDKMRTLLNGYMNTLEESSLTEARNPENDEANELIRTSLNDPEYAKNHATELRKHGIKYLKPEKGYDSGALEGKQGRRLNINKSDWRKNDVRDATNYSDGYYGDDAYSKGYKSDDAHADEIDLHQKNYKNSKSDYALAKNNIKRQRTKVANMKKKDAGKWNGKTFDAEQKLKGYENTLKRGITAGFAPSDSIHPDTDLKGFLNAKKHSDRPLAREKDPKYRRDRGVIVDPSNKDVEDYKWAKSERRYLDKERERINQSNKEDQDRIEEMKKRAAEEKARREKGYKAQEKDWKNVDTKINKKLDKYRQRMSNNK